MKKKETFRFSFGTQELPGSSVWRVNIREKAGDIYINNAPQFGNEIHISLHSSGIFSMKLNQERYKLEPPLVPDKSEFIYGPCIFFEKQSRDLPPPAPSGSVNKIHWLGWPKENHLFCINTYWCRPEVEIRAEESKNERIILGPCEAVLFRELKRFYMIITERVIQQNEISNNNDQWRKLEFNKSKPQAMELIRISKTPQGPSAVIIEGFNTSLINE